MEEELVQKIENKTFMVGVVGLGYVGSPLIPGLAYKANVDDYRESPSFHLIEKLEEKGAEVSYNDPYIPEIGMTREFLEVQVSHRRHREPSKGKLCRQGAICSKDVISPEDR